VDRRGGGPAARGGVPAERGVPGGLPRAADQYGHDLALRAQLEVRAGPGWRVAADSGPGWRVAPSRITAADLIGGQREDHRRLEPQVHDASFDDRAWDGAVARDVDAVIVRSVAPPVRRLEEIRPVAVRPVRDGRAFVVDFGQNFSGWVRLIGPRARGPADHAVVRRVAG
jgi:alpha-L-rhamnosidase